MKYDCGIIRDLLPLYADQVCSEESAEAVRQHVSECSTCAALLQDIRSSETAFDREIAAERSRVLDTQARFFKRRSALAGSIIGGIFAVPILICLIVNLASGAGLTWFFIVLAAMLIPASLIVVPLTVPENKFLWMTGSFTASLLLLLGVCSIYTGGSWFPIAAASVLFGLGVLLLPFIVRTKPAAKLLRGHKALTVIAADTLAFILMISAIAVCCGAPQVIRYAAAFAVPPFAAAWALVLLIRYPKCSGLLKAAACVFVCSLIYFFNDTFVYAVLGRGLHLPPFDFSFASAESYNSAGCWIVLIAGTVLSVIFAVSGLLKTTRKDASK